MSESETHREYECAECGRAFDSVQALYGHKGQTAHDIHGSDRPTRLPSLLARATDVVRIGRDTDGDGKLDVSRAVLWGQRAIIGIGVAVGHTLAHDPTLAYQVVTYASAFLFGGRGIAQLSWTPIPVEWFDSQALMNLGLGMLFGAALVLLPFDVLLDTLAHGLGTHTHG